jgi:cell wall-associated NlpC family hydrolase
MTRLTLRFLPLLALSVAVLSACSSLSPSSPAARPATQIEYFSLADPDQAREIVMISFSLVDTGYRFGGRNPEAGLDCSGMVSYVVEQVSGLRLPHNAAEIAARTRAVARDELRPGDLVFFNTGNRPYSHMGIYLGEDRFIHAPSSQGRVRLENLSSAYFAKRYDGARTLFPTG